MLFTAIVQSQPPGPSQFHGIFNFTCTFNPGDPSTMSYQSTETLSQLKITMLKSHLVSTSLSIVSQELSHNFYIALELGISIVSSLWLRRVVVIMWTLLTLVTG